MPKFETINGTLCRMVEPEPLTENVQFPVAVEIFGKQHILRNKYQVFIPIVFASSYMDMSLNQVPFICFLAAKIIGYPVVEGSKEWALYQMMQGLKVCNPQLAKDKTARAARLGCCNDETFNTYWYIVDNTVVEGKSNYATLSVSSWLFAAPSSGWQIYEPEPEHPAILGYNRYDYVPVEGIKLPKPEPITKSYVCPVCNVTIIAEQERLGHDRYDADLCSDLLSARAGDHMRSSHDTCLVSAFKTRADHIESILNNIEKGRTQ